MGARWRIGTGTSTYVLNQPWIPSKDNPYVISSHESLRRYSVFNLLQDGNMCWDEEVLEDLFEPRDIDLIRNIPLPLTLNMDSWYWAFEDYGNYSVKSAYRALQVLNERWNSQDNSGFWKKFWYLKLPPKVKNFLWRALSNCLPTLVLLQIKRVNVTSICPLCSGDAETTFHLMVTCPFTMACLERGLGFTLMIGDVEFGYLFVSFCNAHPGDGIEKLSIILWGVWGARNDLLWNKKLASVERVVSAAVTYLKLWKVAQLKNGDASTSTSHASAGSELWSKPSLEKSHGFGWIARVPAGVLLTATTEKRIGDVDPVVAEAMSMKEALSWLKQTWGDGGSFEVQFVKRSWNQAVNWLARSSGSCRDRLSCMGSIPIGLEAILLADLH
ncbi:uncharacterized protein LOC133035353 [Cannabis sativa]|uniref:uncharacterized protein LOC133035353 n=1 Tax=Cannabis sativa TaxID=3483 RepID=UPI0029CA00C8|nr:uncharacterized protein LOC133035353 [Cannabis sativa]